MAEHTNPECRHNCNKPLGCCEPIFCHSTANHALKHWNISLEESNLFKEGKTNLPFMGSDGCIVEPHLRPSCTLHTCQMRTFGFKIGDSLWTSHYKSLRQSIDSLEYDRFLESSILSGAMKLYDNYMEDGVERIYYKDLPKDSLIMSINAIVKDIRRHIDGTGSLILEGEERGQSILRFDIFPENIHILKGKQIWGGADTILIGETKIANRIGYTRIEFTIKDFNNI